MYKKKRRICVAWLLGMMLLLCACGNLETGKDQGEVAENDKIQIGMSFDSFVIEEKADQLLHRQRNGCDRCDMH